VVAQAVISGGGNSGIVAAPIQFSFNTSAAVDVQFGGGFGVMVFKTSSIPISTPFVDFFTFGGRIYRSIGAARPAEAAANATVFRTTARSFRAPTAPELARIRESRLRLARARAGETIPALVGRTRSIWEPAMVAAANGLPDGARLANGQLVKVALSEPYAAAH
jgi:hypothetical protein